jgi:hypothetical protein
MRAASLIYPDRLPSRRRWGRRPRRRATRSPMRQPGEGLGSPPLSLCGASGRLSRWRSRRRLGRTGSRTMGVSVVQPYCCTDGVFPATPISGLGRRGAFPLNVSPSSDVANRHERVSRVPNGDAEWGKHRRTGTRSEDLSSTKPLRNQTPCIFWNRDDNNLGQSMNTVKAKQALSHAAAPYAGEGGSA